jgi:exodeoxyribonuclease VIII
MQQSDAARKEIYSKTNIDLDLALMRFTNFVQAGSGPAFVWGNGADFDNAILASAYQLMNIGTPWKFYNNRCYRTVKNLHPQIKLERSGTYHNALDDAVSQTQHLLAILDHANIDI